MLKRCFVPFFIAVLLVLTGCPSESPNKNDSDKSDNEWVDTYDLLFEGNETQNVVGANAENVMANIKWYAHFDQSSNSKFNWLVADMNCDEFKRLVDRLGLERRSDLLTFWPEALDCEEGATEEFKANWKVEKKVDGYTYYGEDPKNATQRVFKYADDKIYIKKLTKYISTSMDGEIVHKKAI